MNIQVIQNLAICVLQLLTLMVPGFLLKKTGLVSENFGRDISNLILYAAQPLLVVVAYITPFDGVVAKRMGVVFILAVVAHFLLSLLSFAFFKRTESGKKKVLRFAFIFSNAGYMGIPLIEYALGTQAVIYASIYVVVFNLFMWTLGHYIYSEDRQYISIIKALLNPISIGTYIGLIIFFFNIHGFFPVDGPVYEVFTMLKDLVAPLSMFIIGYRLADVFKSKNAVDKNLFWGIALRLIVAPLAIFLIIFLLYKTGICADYTAASVILICASTPAAAATTMLAEKFNGNGVYASMIVSVSTVLSLITMPLSALLLYLL